MSVYNYGPGATAEQQQAAANAQNRGPYMGFGSNWGKADVFNWSPTSSQQDPYANTTIPRDLYDAGVRSLAQAQQIMAARANPQPQTRPVNPFQQQNMQNALALRQAKAQAQVNQMLAPPPEPSIFPTAPAAPAPAAPAPAAPSPSMPQFNLPQTPTFGGIGTNYGAGINPNMNVTTGITAGLLPQANIDQSVSAAKAPQTAPSPGSSTAPQQSALNSLFQDATRASQGQNALDLGRNGAYQQSQMGLANQKAQAGAGLDWARLGNQFQQANQSAQQPYLSFLWNLLGSVA